MGCASGHSSLQARAVVQVLGAVGRPSYKQRALKIASTKRNRRMSKIATTATAGGKTVNKSCDTCSIKKRRCDGGRPCSRCVRWGDGHKCTYSTRRPYTSTNRRSRLWSSSASSERAATGTASATSGSPCRKISMESHCHGNDVVKQNASSVIEASPPAGPMATPKIECSTPAIEEVYAELARAQQGVMSLIVSTNSLPPLQASSNGPYQQTAMKQHPVPCCELDEGCDIGVGYAEMMPRTVWQNNQKSGDIAGREIDCPVPASPAALVRDVSIEEDDGISSTLDLDVNIIPSGWSDDDTPVVPDVSVISFDQHLPPNGENTADNTAAVAPAGQALDQTLWPLEKEEEDAISAEDWFEVALIL